MQGKQIFCVSFRRSGGRSGGPPPLDFPVKGEGFVGDIGIRARGGCEFSKSSTMRYKYSIRLQVSAGPPPINANGYARTMPEGITNI